MNNGPVYFPVGPLNILKDLESFRPMSNSPRQSLDGRNRNKEDLVNSL